ncbi:hypothetical protein A2W24_03370 [Microgenomates group bacterium RBG_16_45_19]|nr:MAG: hypothetical protein A2W24_03370 [Microgenomates group bacterium RBG_16_45_19]
MSLPVEAKTRHHHHLAQIFILISFAALGLTAVILGLLIILTNQQVKKIALTRQELVNLSQVTEGSQSLQDFALNHQADLAALDYVFPTEDDFVYVLQDIEQVVSAVDPQGVVKLGASKPVIVANRQVIPLTIKLTTTPMNAIIFLRQFERLPYILEITNLELITSPGQTDLAEVMLTVRLYVADTFNP